MEVAGTWGTICDDNFSYTAAAVVCRQMGLPFSAAVAVSGIPYGKGTGKIWLDNVNCRGNETSVSSCHHNTLGNNDCDHSEDVSVMCQSSASTANVTARLVNGPTPTEGRLEVLVNGQWGSVCDDGFARHDNAPVACRMLGLSTHHPASFSNARYGQGSGAIWMDDVTCTGRELSLANCSHRPYGLGDCSHDEDVGISCPPVDFLNVSVRLAGGGDSHSGRVEIFHQGTWGTVCDDGWGIPEANVICKQLGFGNTLNIPIPNAYYGHGSGGILIDDINCIGNESNIGNCQHAMWGSNNCDHSEDASAMCLTGVQPAPPIQVRLAGGVDKYQGRLEIMYRGVWGTVCDDQFQVPEATVVCRMLGFGSSGIPIHHPGSGSGPIWLDDLACVGTEFSLANCSSGGWGEHDCDHTEDAGVDCTQPATLSLDVRLSGGTAGEGRVEVKYAGSWGSICDNHWTATEAQVICRQKGFSTNNATGVSGALFGPGRGQVVLGNVYCVGTEANLTMCNIGSVGTSDCDHSHDVGVICHQAGSVTSVYGVRLVNGSTANEGRVEVQINGGEWGTVCDDHWDVHDATVVCRMLNLSTNKVYARGAGYFPAGTGSILLDDTDCRGSETSVSQCGHAGIGATNCDHSQDAGVICGESVNNASVRLIGGMTSYEGRVEIFHSGQWGSICDDDFTNDHAMVVCRSLGYPVTSAQAYGKAHFGSSTGPIWLDDINCIGDESFLEECSIRGWGNTDCQHSEDVGVICTVPTIKIRLANGGPVVSQGRVEIYMNGTWGTVCSDMWDVRDAAVTCAMLGYSRQNAVAVQDGRFGRGAGDILLDDVGCLGSEATISQCPAKTGQHIRCTHAQDAGITCHQSTVSVRLEGTAQRGQGRVEVQFENTWGTICDDHFTDLNAEVICRMTNNPTAGAYFLPRSHFGSGSGPVLLDGLQCLGTERSVSQCSHNAWNTSSCQHTQDVSVVCPAAAASVSQVTPTGTSRLPTSTPNPAETFVRLVGGSTAYQGRVEVFAFGSWGTVCDSTWDVQDAAVICSMLGYSDFSSGGSIQRQAPFGEGTGPVWLDSVACVGSEVAITQCPLGRWGADSCDHSHDAGVTCSSAQLPNNFLLITDSADRKIYRMDGRTYSYVDIPVSASDSPVAIDYDFLDGRIIWTDVGSKQIRSVTLSGTTEKVIWQLNTVAVPNGISVDPVTRLIFYTDTGNDIIGLMTIDGFAHLTIIKEDLDEPRAIVADSSTGLVYWCDYGHSPKIERASYDGSMRTPLVTKQLIRPTGIALNPDGDELYWCDEGSGKIEKSRLDGRNRVVLSSRPGSQYFGIIYFSDYLFFTDWSQQTVFRMDYDGSGMTTVGPGGFGRLNDIHYHRDGWGPSGTNACSNGRGGCSHICLPNPGNGFFCICPDGLTLQPDGRICGITKPCPALFPPKYGSVFPSNCTEIAAAAGKYCTVTCMQGFSLIGQPNLQCMSNGQWNNLGSPLVCQDTQGPNITCPKNLFAKAPQGHETATVNWTQPAVTDNTGERC
ncbi:scavenger receptor cysteine-rich type 1 protein M130-like isoform X2 [Haliotis cracherodii]|uniref:scavenger receptor cysteine-rich type 1 protein M130-like isoform X2 n=1 Tax=Haliotis cracherodii TaxID=6455 RepID=UPI0039E885D9